MIKYDPLRDYLENLASDIVEKTLTFQRIEEILGDSLPPSARNHRAWWSNPTSPTYQTQAQAWLAAGWRVATVDQQREWVCFTRGKGSVSHRSTHLQNSTPTSKGPQAKTLQRMERRVGELIADFDSYFDAFDQANLFIGPSLYFHLKTIELRRRYTSAIAALADDAFLESIYATLVSWGMHRMGPGDTKMVGFPDMVSSFKRQTDQIRQLEDLHIWEIDQDIVPHVTDRLWDIIRNLEIGIGKTKIVAGSKALHHVLPELVPPIDRQYTVRFFYHHTTFSRGDEAAFREMYPHFLRIAKTCRDEIQPRLGTKMNTSVTKVIDNAIVGYGLKRLR